MGNEGFPTHRYRPHLKAGHRSDLGTGPVLRPCCAQEEMLKRTQNMEFSQLLLSPLGICTYFGFVLKPYPSTRCGP